MRGHTLVICPDVSDAGPLGEMELLAAYLGMKMVKMDAAKHDEEMALVQGLTFFIAHALKELNLHDQRLSTPSFKKLLSLAELENHHSYDLFLTIQAGNEKTQDIRKRFIKLCQDLDAKIQDN